MEKNFHPDTSHWYPLKHLEVRGQAIVINNFEFANTNKKLELRKFWANDESKIVNIFRSLKLDIPKQNIYQNLTREETLRCLREANHEAYASFALFIGSHGFDGGGIHCTDKPINLNEIITLLSKCKALAGKPKLIFIQACQGTKSDTGVAIGSRGSRALIEFHSTMDSGSMPPSLPSSLPPIHGLGHVFQLFTEDLDLSDFFIFHSSFPGFTSYRVISSGTKTHIGSPFVRYLSETLPKFTSGPSNKKHLLVLATVVCHTIAIEFRAKRKRKKQNGELNREEDECKQMPSWRSTLTKLFPI